MHPWLSSNIGILCVVGNPRFSISCCSQRSSLEASEAATYSASVEERATVVCLRLAHATKLPPSLKTNPLVDFLSFLSPAQSASTKQHNFILPATGKVSFWSSVVAR